MAGSSVLPRCRAEWLSPAMAAPGPELLACQWRPIMWDTRAIKGVNRGVTPGLSMARGVQRAKRTMRILTRLANRRLEGER